MIEYYVERWENNKNKLKEFLTSLETPIQKYIDVIKYTIKYALNPGCDESSVLDYDNIIEIGLGEYQGSLVYIICLKDRDYEEVYMTSVFYGSCSGCDTLMGLEEEDKELRIDGYMQLCLNVVQHLKEIYNPNFRLKDMLEGK